MKTKKKLIGIGAVMAILEMVLLVLLANGNSSVNIIAWISTLSGAVLGITSLIVAAMGSN
jgi:hypothetical protein